MCINAAVGLIKSSADHIFHHNNSKIEDRLLNKFFYSYFFRTNIRDDYGMIYHEKIDESPIKVFFGIIL